MRPINLTVRQRFLTWFGQILKKHSSEKSWKFLETTHTTEMLLESASTQCVVQHLAPLPSHHNTSEQITRDVVAAEVPCEWLFGGETHSHLFPLTTTHRSRSHAMWSREKCRASGYSVGKPTRTSSLSLQHIGADHTRCGRGRSAVRVVIRWGNPLAPLPSHYNTSEQITRDVVAGEVPCEWLFGGETHSHLFPLTTTHRSRSHVMWSREKCRASGYSVGKPTRTSSLSLQHIGADHTRCGRGRSAVRVVIRWGNPLSPLPSHYNTSEQITRDVVAGEVPCEWLFGHFGGETHSHLFPLTTTHRSRSHVMWSREKCRASGYSVGKPTRTSSLSLQHIGADHTRCGRGRSAVRVVIRWGNPLAPLPSHYNTSEQITRDVVAGEVPCEWLFGGETHSHLFSLTTTHRSRSHAMWSMWRNDIVRPSSCLHFVWKYQVKFWHKSVWVNLACEWIFSLLTCLAEAKLWRTVKFIGRILNEFSKFWYLEKAETLLFQKSIRFAWFWNSETRYIAIYRKS